MADLKADGFKSSDVLVDLDNALRAFTDAQRQAQVKKTKGVFELRITNADKQEAVWTIDLKNTGAILKGPASPPADVTLLMADDTLSQLASGKLDGQKAFLTGKLKTKGNAMLATKLSAIFEIARGKAKL